MRCGKVDRLLEAYVAGELDASREEAVRGHLAACPACRRRAALCERIDLAVSRYEPAEVPAGALADLSARIAREAATMRGRARRGRRLRTRLTWEAAAGLAVVLSLLDLTGLLDVSERAMELVRLASVPISLASLRVTTMLQENVAFLKDISADSVSIALKVVIVFAAFFFIAATADFRLASRTRRKFRNLLG